MRRYTRRAAPIVATFKEASASWLASWTGTGTRAPLAPRPAGSRDRLKNGWTEPVADKIPTRPHRPRKASRRPRIRRSEGEVSTACDARAADPDPYQRVGRGRSLDRWFLPRRGGWEAHDGARRDRPGRQGLRSTEPWRELPSGLKWSFLPPADGGPPATSVNADGRASTCEDIPLIMGSPHVLIGESRSRRAIGCVDHAFDTCAGHPMYCRLRWRLCEATEDGVTRRPAHHRTRRCHHLPARGGWTPLRRRGTRASSPVPPRWPIAAA